MKRKTWLRACPFCGGTPILQCGMRNGRKIVAYISCQECKATGEKFESRLEDEAVSDAVTAWDKRFWFDHHDTEEELLGKLKRIRENDIKNLEDQIELNRIISKYYEIFIEDMTLGFDDTIRKEARKCLDRVEKVADEWLKKKDEESKNSKPTVSICYNINETKV